METTSAVGQPETKPEAAPFTKMDQELASIGVSRNAREHISRLMRNQPDA